MEGKRWGRGEEGVKKKGKGKMDWGKWEAKSTREKGSTLIADILFWDDWLEWINRCLHLICDNSICADWNSCKLRGHGQHRWSSYQTWWDQLSRFFSPCFFSSSFFLSSSFLLVDKKIYKVVVAPESWVYKWLDGVQYLIALMTTSRQCRNTTGFPLVYSSLFLPWPRATLPRTAGPYMQ